MEKNRWIDDENNDNVIQGSKSTRIWIWTWVVLVQQLPGSYRWCRKHVGFEDESRRDRLTALDRATQRWAEGHQGLGLKSKWNLSKMSLDPAVFLWLFNQLFNQLSTSQTITVLCYFHPVLMTFIFNVCFGKIKLQSLDQERNIWGIKVWRVSWEVISSR